MLFYRTVTLRDLITAAESIQMPMLIGFASLVVATKLIGILHGPEHGSGAPWRYLYSFLLYAACVPGIFSAVLFVYSLFFTAEDLLDVNLTVYLVPVVAMVVTIGLMRRSVDFKSVPGFNRLTGLITMIAVAFIVAIVLRSLRVWLFFGASLAWFFGLSVGIFLLFNWGGRLLFGRKRP